MKKIFTIVLLTILISNYGSAQEKDSIIKDIRVKFKELNSHNNYRVLKFGNEEFMEDMTDGGGELKAYVKNDTIYKIYERIGLSFGVRKVEYYFWEGNLFFAFQTEEVFNHVFHIADTVEIEMSMDEAYELIKTCEIRYYFNNDTIVDFLVNGEPIWGIDDKEKEIESTIESSKHYYDFIKQKL